LLVAVAESAMTRILAQAGDLFLRDDKDMGSEVDDELYQSLRLSEAKEGLYKEVGRAIVALSNIENLMAMAFISVTQGMTREEAAELFYSYRDFDQKFKLVSYAIRQNDFGDEFAAWERLSEKLQQHKFVRNLAAHQGMQFKEDNTSGDRKVILKAPWFKKRSKAKELEILDVKKSADGLEAIQMEMWEFIKNLAPSLE
jgi:hypothetical protein